MKAFADYGIQVPANARGPEVFLSCPKCSHTRTKARAPCLSVNIEKGVWCCHHCDWSGGLKDGARSPVREQKPVYRKPEALIQKVLSPEFVNWFHSRGITDEVIVRNRIETRRCYFLQLEEFIEAIIFPYFRGGQLINIKYRSIPEKYFRLESQCELVLYGLDDIDPAEPLIWVEGEMDKLALEVAGFKNVVSVPNGAPPPDAKNYQALLKFIEADSIKIQAVKRHILAGDADIAGVHLEGELSRRLGIEKCSRVRWPEGVKDANQMLIKHDAVDLAWYIDNAEPFPIEGVFQISDRREDVLRLYKQGFERGHRTGWRELDKFYTVRPGEFTAVTGIPSSGKSNWLDCLLVNLAKLHDWNFAIFSPENLPLEQHMAAIAEKYAGKPFHDGVKQRMSTAELEAAMQWTDEHFAWIMPSSEDDWTVEKILARASQLCLRRGIRGLVIDPWNELESLRPSTMTETEFISQSLKRIRVFARNRGVHVWVVVHPSKLYRNDAGKYPVPTLYDCSGSAHWRNKADNGVVVWRDLSEADSAEVQIHIQKIRFRQVGQRGTAKLYYEPVCATYSESGPSNGYAPHWANVDERL